MLLARRTAAMGDQSRPGQQQSFNVVSGNMSPASSRRALGWSNDNVSAADPLVNSFLTSSPTGASVSHHGHLVVSPGGNGAGIHRTGLRVSSPNSLGNNVTSAFTSIGSYPGVSSGMLSSAATAALPGNSNNTSSSIVAHLRAAAMSQSRFGLGAGVASSSPRNGLDLEMLERARLLELSMIDAERRQIVERMRLLRGGPAVGDRGTSSPADVSPMSTRSVLSSSLEALSSAQRSVLLDEAMKMATDLSARTPLPAPTASLAALLAANQGTKQGNAFAPQTPVGSEHLVSKSKATAVVSSPPPPRSPSCGSVTPPLSPASQRPTVGAKAQKQPVVLYMRCDEDSLSDYQCLIRKHMELFVVSDADGELAGNVQGRNKQVTKGQVGLRCRHCAAFNRNKKACGDAGVVKGAMYFPTKLARIYQAAQNLSTYHLADACPCVPADVKQRIRLLRERKSPAGGGKRYWAESVACQGVYEDGHGLRFR